MSKDEAIRNIIVSANDYRFKGINSTEFEKAVKHYIDEFSNQSETDKKYYKCNSCGIAVEELQIGNVCDKCYQSKKDIDWLDQYDNCYEN